MKLSKTSEKRKAYYSKNKHQWSNYYQSNTDSIKEKARRHYWKNRDRIILQIRTRRQSNPQENRERCKKWRTENRETWLAGKKRWWNKNKPALQAKQRQYYQRNRDRIKQRSALYAKLNPEVPSNTGAKRRAQKARTRIDTKAIRTWMRQIKNLPFARCHWCGDRISGTDVHFDHVIALHIGGTHTIGNLCASCMNCNSSKHARPLTEWVCRGQMFFPI